jgi:RHS repeat-associated protein
MRSKFKCGFLIFCLSLLGLSIADEPPLLPSTEIHLVVPTVGEVPQTLSFSAEPTTGEINSTRVFHEPLIPFWGEPSVEENQALAEALLAFSQRAEADDFSALTGFLKSPIALNWYPSVLFALAEEYYHTGYYSRALEAWEECWNWTQFERGGAGKALADRAVGELARMNARIGGLPALNSLLNDIEGRTLVGPATETVAGAKQARWLMENKPEIAYRCGPLALNTVRRFMHPGEGISPLLLESRSTHKGFSLKELDELAHDINLQVKIGKRGAGASFVLPAVVHWRVGHYAAILKKEGNYFWVIDPTFGEEGMWISQRALEEESSGYFMVPDEQLPNGWTTVNDQESETVYGKGVTSSSNPDHTTPADTKANPDCITTSVGMTTYQYHLMLVSLNLEDTPLQFSPPRGSPVEFTVTYNQREANQPAGFTYSNFGDKWTCNWIGYITDSGASNPVGDVMLYVRGGGTETYTGYNSTNQTFAVQARNQTVLVRSSSTSYELKYPDGSREIFSQPDGTVGNTRKVFLTQVIDTTGYTNLVNYDSKLRIATITDPAAGMTNFTFEYNDNPLAGSDLTIRKVTDRYGRYAQFGYEGLGFQLISITDSISITSEFSYSGSFINQLKTPYGMTTFDYGEDGRTRWLEATDPLGNKTRAEFTEDPLTVRNADPGPIVPAGMYTRNSILNARNTFYWDKKAMREAPGDYSKARIYHWLHGPNWASAIGILESYKEPFENRIWLNYPGQIQQDEGATLAGTQNLPSRIGRVLDDGSTQLWQYDRSFLGYITNAVDPAGRKFSYSYATNGIDLLEVRQTTGGNNELLAAYTYNSQHLPLTAIDAAGKITKLSFNSYGQLTGITNALQQVTSFNYDSAGRLQTIDGPQAGTNDVITFVHDSFDRVRTVTDSDGYSVTTDYDNLDRPLTNSFPDSSVETFAYRYLDLDTYTDRAGSVLKTVYNAVRQLTQIQQATNWITDIDYCNCGSVSSVIDPFGRKTQWIYDVQGRLTKKLYADNTAIDYTYEKTTSRLQTIKNERGQIKTNVWNIDDNLYAVLYAPGSLTTNVYFDWDSNYERLRGVYTGTSATNLFAGTRYGYYPVSSNTLGAGRLRYTTNWLSNFPVEFGYDELGRVTSEKIYAGGVYPYPYNETRTFDVLGRLTNVNNALGSITYYYDGASTRLSSIYKGGDATINSFGYYDKFGDFRLKGITNAVGGDSSATQFSYIYNKAGQITNWVQIQNGTTKTYRLAYDALGELTNSVLLVNGTLSDTNSFTYDPAGNRLTEKNGGSAWNAYYNAANELVGKTAPAALSRTITFDQENRVMSITTGGNRTDLFYNEFGRCVSIKEYSSGSLQFDRILTWVGDKLVQEVIVVSGGSGLYKAYYDDGYYDTYDNAALYFSRDHLGSVRETTYRPSTGGGTLEARYDYDLFGRKTTVQSLVASGFEPLQAFAGLYETSGYNLAPNRMYDPDLGRWISRDPIGEVGGFNLFTYAGNDPVNQTDPSGLCPDERGFAGRDGQFRDPNSGIIKDSNGIPIKDQLNPFNPENFQSSSAPRLRPGQAGRFGDLDDLRIVRDGLTPHHMPQAALNFTSREEGGAMMLQQAEHILTRTYLSRGAVLAQKERGLPFRLVLARDIRDLRQITGRRYSDGVKDLLKYYREKFPELIGRGRRKD